MINLEKTKSIGKKLLVSTGLIAFLSNGIAPVAFSIDNYYPTTNRSTGTAQTSPRLEANAVRNVLLKGDLATTAKGSQKIAISLRDSDVKQVLRMFADKAGLNIVFHKSVEGTVTLDLVNVSLNDAFAMVMQMADLTYTIDKNTLLVTSSEEAKKLSFTKEVMAAVPVKYVDANTMAQFLNKNIFTKGRPGLSNSEIAVSNPRENEVLIFGSKSDYKVAQQIIAEMDKPLKITTYKVNHTTPKEMAQLICDTWFKEKGTEGDELDDNSESEIVVGGGVIACSVDSKDESQGDMESFKVQGLKVAYFPTQGIVKLYGGTAQQAADVQRLIADADKKQPQAMLEVSVIELNEEGTKTLSNQWQVYTNFFSGTIGGTGIQTDTATNLSHPLMFGDRSTLNIVDASSYPWTKIGEISHWSGKARFHDVINWVIENKDGRVLANPKIMLTSGQPSTIDLTEEYIDKATTETTASGTGSIIKTTYTKSSEGAGVKVDLIPFISLDGYISLNIKPSYSTIANQVTDKTTGNILMTLINKRDLDLKNIRIKDGETLVIGGMIKETEEKTVNKAPILGDIPVVGALFRSSTNHKIKTEMIIMLTPHIIKDAEDLVDSTQYEAL